MEIVIRWLINSLILFVLPEVVPGVSVTDFPSALAMALVLGIINAIIRPVLFMFSLPITLISLGLFTFIINGGLFLAASYLVSGYQVDSFLTAVIASLVVTLANIALKVIGK